MGYRLVYTEGAAKDIRRLHPQVKQRLKLALERYSEAPLQFALRLTNSEVGTYRFRVGDYRVVFDIQGDGLIILRVGHRREIYRDK